MTKTKLLIFKKGKSQNEPRFRIGTSELENVEEYKYLGILFSKTGSFVKAKQYIAGQANKALFALLRKIKSLSLPFDIQIELFEKNC